MGQGRSTEQLRIYMHLYLRYVPAADRHDPELSLETETRVEDEIAVLLPLLISSCQGGPTRTEVAEAGVGAVKHSFTC